MVPSQGGRAQLFGVQSLWIERVQFAAQAIECGLQLLAPLFAYRECHLQHLK